jgi:hypothetical protein
MNKNTMMIAAVIFIVFAAVAGFVGGMQYQKANAGSNFTQGGNGTFRQRFGATGQNGQNFRPVRGQILNMDNNSLTVKLSDGSTKIVVLSGSTVYLKSTKALQSDLKTGDTVNVIGAQNSDGSVTAQDVQLNPLTNQGK